MFIKKEYRKGQVIVRQGTHGTSAFVIETGKVEVSRQDESGNKTVITVLKDRDIFGEMGLITGAPRTANVIALEDCSIAILTRENFSKLPQNNPAVMKIKQIMAERLRANEKLPSWATGK